MKALGPGKPKPRKRKGRKTPKKTPRPGTKLTMPGLNGGTLNRGNPGNKGGLGREPKELRERARYVLGLTLGKMIGRLEDVETPKWFIETPDLIRMAAVSGRLSLPQQIEHAGPEGGPIPFEQMRDSVAEQFRKALADAVPALA